MRPDPRIQYREILGKYIPEPAVETMADWILVFNFNLKITRSRSTKLGDYRHPWKNERHVITINHNLNRYAFLITLVHEIAHLTTWNRHRNQVKPHGAEWKSEYKRLMDVFMDPGIFPADVLEALRRYMHNPAASSCSDDSLLRVLRRYDPQKIKTVHVEELPPGSLFRTGKNRFFIKGEKVRKRIRCQEVNTRDIYLFSPTAEVFPVASTLFADAEF